MRPILLILILAASVIARAQRNNTLRIDTSGGALTISQKHHPLLARPK